MERDKWTIYNSVKIHLKLLKQSVLILLEPHECNHKFPVNLDEIRIPETKTVIQF